MTDQKANSNLSKEEQEALAYFESQRALQSQSKIWKVRRKNWWTFYTPILFKIGIFWFVYRMFRLTNEGFPEINTILLFLIIIVGTYVEHLNNRIDTLVEIIESEIYLKSKGQKN